jgi:hypothetical protein
MYGQRPTKRKNWTGVGRVIACLAVLAFLPGTSIARYPPASVPPWISAANGGPFYGGDALIVRNKQPLMRTASPASSQGGGRQ